MSYVKRNLSDILLWFFPVAMGAMALIPPLIFGFEFGFHYHFDAAPDESFYAYRFISPDFSWNQRPIGVFNEALWVLAGKNPVAYYMISDFFLVTFSCATALVLARQFTRAPHYALAIAFGAVFFIDFFGLNSRLAPWGALTIHDYVRDLPLEWRRYFVDAHLTYITVGRTPEPQTSMPVFLLCSTAIVKWLRMESRSSLNTVLLALAVLLNMMAYTFYAVGGILLLGCAVLVQLYRRKFVEAVIAAGIALAGFVLLAVSSASSHSSIAGDFLFPSRLPLVAPTMIYGTALLVLIAAVATQRQNLSWQLLAGALLALLPTLVLNQQVITGWMVQSLNWERYINPAAIVLSLAFVGGTLQIPKARNLFPRHTSMATGICFAIIVVLVGNAQLRNYRFYLNYNLSAEAQARSLLESFDRLPNLPRRIFLEDMSQDQLVHMRLGALSLAPNGYSAVIANVNLKPDLDPKIRPKNWLLGFEHASRLGLTVEQLRQALLEDVRLDRCWTHLLFYVSILKCAPYVSDFRHYDREGLMATVPGVISAYRDYLAEQTAGSAVVVRATRQPPCTANRKWLNVALVVQNFERRSVFLSGQSNHRVFVYEQKPLAEQNAKQCNDG